jgi:hypothetical protein
MTVNIVFNGSSKGYHDSSNTCNNTSVTYSITRQLRNVYTVDPFAPSLLFQANPTRKLLIFKSPLTSLAKFKIVAFDRSIGHPANFGTTYTSIDTELFGEILPGGILTLDNILATADIYGFADIDLAPIKITISEER